MNSSTRRFQIRNIPWGILAFYQWPEARNIRKNSVWGSKGTRSDGIRWIFYRDILTALTDLQIFEHVSSALLKSRKNCCYGKILQKISHIADNAYMAGNRSHKRWARHYSAGKFNVNLCFTLWWWLNFGEIEL